MINTGTVIESLLLAILGAKTGKFGYSGQDNAIIQVVIMLMVGFYSYFSAKTSSANSTQKIDEAKTHTRRQKVYFQIFPICQRN